MSGFDALAQGLLNSYAHEFGRRKLEKIADRVERSNKVRRFIQTSEREGDIPLQHVLPMLHEIPTFIFSRAETLAVGAIGVVALWNQHCNPNEERISDFDLGLLMQEVLQSIGRLHGR